MHPETIGDLAALLTTAAYVPQVVKVARHRHTKSISLGMYFMLTIGIGLWFVYGWMIGSPSLMLANGLTFLMALFIMAMKVRWG